MSWLGKLVSRGGVSGTPKHESAADARARVEACLHDEIVPALESVRDRLVAEGHAPELEVGEAGARLAVTNFNRLPLEYAVTIHVYRQPVVNLTSFEDARGGTDREHFGRIEILAAGHSREYEPGRCDREAIERAALAYYRRYLMDTPQG